jgi:glycosyltransferase involved in cell wall biosynthesis
MPRVSVCIPTYNSENFIAQTIECVLNQTLSDFEIVVTDNCSTDATVEICEKYKKLDSRVSLYRHETNKGAFPNFNSGLAIARGEFLKFLMSDDLLEPTCLERKVEIFDRFSSVKVVSSSQQNVNEDGKNIRSVSAYPESCLIDGRKVTKDLLLKMSNDIGAPTNVLVRRTDYGTGFDCSFYFFADLELWLRILRQGDYYFLNEPLTTLRIHQQSGTTDNFKTLLFISDILQFKDMFADFMQQEGISQEEWGQIIEGHIMAYVDYIFLEEGITEEDVRKYILRMKSRTGAEHLDGLLKSMATLIFYGFLRMHKLNIDARWNKGQANNLEREIDKMKQTIVWKMAEPLRSVRSKLSRTKTE